MKLWCCIAIAGVLCGCGEEQPAPSETGREGGDVTIVDPNGAVIEGDVPAVTQRSAPPAADARAVAANYADAVERFASIVMKRPRPVDAIPTMRTFSVRHDIVETTLRHWQRDFAEKGAAVFRLYNSHGTGDGLDSIAMLPTSDKYEVIRTLGTAGPAHDVSNANVIEWLKQLEAEHDWVLTGCGYDFLAGYLVNEPADIAKLAVDITELCPDLVPGRYPSVTDLAMDLRQGNLYLRWE